MSHNGNMLPNNNDGKIATKSTVEIATQAHPQGS